MFSSDFRNKPAPPGGGLGFPTHNRTPAALLRLIWQEEYVEETMPEGFHDFFEASCDRR